MMRDRNRPTHTAFHEAGHVVACWALDVAVDYATIVPTSDHAGLVKHRPVRPRERHAIISFAGPAAQRRSHPKSDIVAGASHDASVIELTAEVLFDALHHRTSYIRQADKAARALVDDHWLAIDRVARALMRKGALSGFALVSIIEQAEEEWSIVAAMNPGLDPFSYAKRDALQSQGLPPLRRTHLEAAALRATLAGKTDVEAAIVADLTARGYAEPACRDLWRRIQAQPQTRTQP